MSSFNIVGKLAVIKDVQHISESFKKREFILEVMDGEYPQLIQLEVIQDKCAVLDGCTVGQQLTIDFNLRGRKWTNGEGVDKYFNTLQAWKINKGEGVSSAPTPPAMGDDPVSDSEIPF